MSRIILHRKRSFSKYAVHSNSIETLLKKFHCYVSKIIGNQTLNKNLFSTTVFFQPVNSRLKFFQCCIQKSFFPIFMKKFLQYFVKSKSKPSVDPELDWEFEQLCTYAINGVYEREKKTKNQMNRNTRPPNIGMIAPVLLFNTFNYFFVDKTHLGILS